MLRTTPTPVEARPSQTALLVSWVTKSPVAAEFSYWEWVSEEILGRIWGYLKPSKYIRVVVFACSDVCWEGPPRCDSKLRRCDAALGAHMQAAMASVSISTARKRHLSIEICSMYTTSA
jgi:hypothetical protein